MTKFFLILLFYLYILIIFVRGISLSKPAFHYCDSDIKRETKIENQHTLKLIIPDVFFNYHIINDEKSNRRIVAIDNVTFEGFMTYTDLNLTDMLIKVKFTDMKEIRAGREIEYRGANDIRYYCNIVLLKEKNSRHRPALQPDIEHTIRSFLLPCIQYKICTPFSGLKNDAIKEGMKYRTKSAIVSQSLQNTVNAVSDFIVSRLVYALTNKKAKIPEVIGYFTYPISGNTVQYKLIKGTFINVVKAERIVDTKVLQERDKISVYIVYRLKDINMDFIFKLSDRSYNGRAAVYLKKIVFSATILFDYMQCKASLDKFNVAHIGDITGEVSEGLVFYEQDYGMKFVKVIVQMHAENVLKEIISYKINSFRCGQIQKELNEDAAKWGTLLGNLINKYLGSTRNTSE